MTRRWPDTLPRASWPDYALQPAEQSLRTDMEAGAARVRRLTRVRRDLVMPEWRLTDAEMWAFRAWFGDEAVADWGSDSLAGWALTGAAATTAAVLGPSAEPVDGLDEDGSTGAHQATRAAPGVLTGQTAVVHVSLRAAARSRARVELTGRDGVARHATLDLAAGLIETASGVTEATLTSRGNGWWRLRFLAAVGSGASAAVLRIAAMDGAGETYAGTSAAALSLAEMQVRARVAERDLFLPAAADGTALGAAGGSAWFLADIATGGGLTRREARFTAMWQAKPMQGLNWQVRGALEVRDA
jgi:hypothetical protein